MNKLMENAKMRILVITVTSVLLLVVVAIASAAFQIGLAKGKEKEDAVSVRSDAIGAFAELREEPTDTEAPPLLFESNGDGSCTLVGRGSYEGDVLMLPSKNAKGEIVVAIADRALEGCADLTQIHLPATVKLVGSGAFVGCSALSAITVSETNTVFTSEDGILLSRDKTRLVCYPPAKEGESFLLRTEIESVAAYAFDGILHLKNILYTGNTAQYQAIRVEAGNTALLSLSVTCNYKPMEV